MLVSCRWMHARLLDLGVDEPPIWTPGVGTSAFGPQLRDGYLHDKWSCKRSQRGPFVVVGYVGSLYKRNGVRRLTEAAQVPVVRLVVIGDSPQKAWLKTQVPDAKFLGALESRNWRSRWPEPLSSAPSLHDRRRQGQALRAASGRP